MTADARQWYLYVVRCSDQTLYTGITVNVERRLKQHNAGKGARYTSTRRPVTLLAMWSCSGQGDALRAERAFKGLSRTRKLKWIASDSSFEGAEREPVSGISI